MDKNSLLLLTARCWIVSIFFVSINAAHSDLKPLDDSELANSTAQAGLEIDLDLSDIGIIYSYSNAENNNADMRYWTTAANAGSGDDAVGANLGSGDGLAQLLGITLDVIDIPGEAGGAIAIGLPSEVKLNRVNVGDYYVTRPGPDPDNSPPPADEVAVPTNRKLFGVKLNTPPSLDFSGTGQEILAAPVLNKNFSADSIKMSGQVLIFAN